MIERHWRQMASPISWMVDARTEPEWLESLSVRLRALFAEVEGRLSRFQDTSELMQLNRNLGQWTEVSPMLYRALATAAKAGQLTAGLFDPRIIVDLDRLGYKGGHLPAADGAWEGEGWLERCPRDHRVRTQAPIDLGGIGKSLAVLWGGHLIARFLDEKEQSCPPMLLNAGGDLQMLGDTVPEPDGWVIGMEHPERDDGHAMVLNFSRPVSVCTSSIRRRRWLHEGRRVHHLIHPEAHEPGGRGLLSVTVAHSRPTWAEVWSKALFLQGKSHISSFAKTHGVTAWWLLEDGSWDATMSATDHIAWIHSDIKASGSRSRD